MAFGSMVPTGKVSYPTSPTWMSYNGDDSKCMDNVPLLLRPELFCQAFLAEARVFRYAFAALRSEALSRDMHACTCFLICDADHHLSLLKVT